MVDGVELVAQAFRIGLYVRGVDPALHSFVVGGILRVGQGGVIQRGAGFFQGGGVLGQLFNQLREVESLLGFQHFGIG